MFGNGEELNEGARDRTYLAGKPHNLYQPWFQMSEMVPSMRDRPEDQWKRSGE